MLFDLAMGEHDAATVAGLAVCLEFAMFVTDTGRLSLNKFYVAT